MKRTEQEHSNATPPWSRTKRAAHAVATLRTAQKALEIRTEGLFEEMVQYRLEQLHNPDLEQYLREEIVPSLLREQIRLAKLYLSTHPRPLGPEPLTSEVEEC